MSKIGRPKQESVTHTRVFTADIKIIDKRPGKTRPQKIRNILKKVKA